MLDTFLAQNVEILRPRPLEFPFQLIIGAIELDDKSHETDRAKARDTFIDAALEAAGVPILHVPAQRVYNVAELQSQLAATIFPAAAGSTPDGLNI